MGCASKLPLHWALRAGPRFGRSQMTWSGPPRLVPVIRPLAQVSTLSGRNPPCFDPDPVVQLPIEHVRTPPHPLIGSPRSFDIRSLVSVHISCPLALDAVATAFPSEPFKLWMSQASFALVSSFID